MILLFTILFAFEAWHDATVIQELLERGGQETAESRRLNDLWHRISAMSSVLVVLMISLLWYEYTGYHWALSIMGGMMTRYFCLTYVLNGIRGLPLYHKGQGTIDRIASMVGPRASFIITSITVIGLFIIEIQYHV